MPISLYAVELNDFFKYVNYITNSVYHTMYLKHYFIRNSFILENAYSVLFNSKLSENIKFSLFSQIFFELITTNFNNLVKKY